MARIRSIPAAALPRFRSSDRYLYVIGEEGSNLVKIGRADHPLWRLSSLQAGNSRRLSLHAAWVGDRAAIVSLEASLHDRFNAQRVAFEWFDVSLSAIEAAIEEMAR